MNFMTPHWDLALFRLGNEAAKNWLMDWAMPLASSAVFLWLIVAGVVIWGAVKRGRSPLLMVVALLLSLALADAGTAQLKKAVGRVRPLNALALTHFVEDGQWQQRSATYEQTKTRGTSYPSAHAANAMAAATIMMLLWPATRRSMWLLPLIVGFSRIYLGKHYPTDVAMGWLFGLCVAMVVYMGLKMLGKIPPEADEVRS